MAFVVTIPGVLGGQQPARPCRHRFCFRPNAQTGCDWFPITEVAWGGKVAVVGYVDPNEEHAVGIWQLGVAHLLGPRFALGVVVGAGSVGGGSNTTLFSVAPRARLQLTRLVSLDLTPGLLFGGSVDRNLSFSGTCGWQIEAQPPDTLRSSGVPWPSPGQHPPTRRVRARAVPKRNSEPCCPPLLGLLDHGRG